MSEQTVRLDSGPEVAGFVQRVRARLADLTEDEREELVDGLEADLAELVSDGGSVSELGDPGAYADELRAAAGLGRGTPTVGPSRAPVSQACTTWLDALHATWDESMQAPAVRGTWGLLVTLRPLWWVFRAWLAVQLLDIGVPGQLYTDIDMVPRLDVPGLGLVILAAAVVVSVQIGRGRLWPGRRQPADLLPRLVLLGLNLFAVGVAPVVVGLLPTQTDVVQSFDAGYLAGQDTGQGMKRGNHPVGNVFAYDAAGRPLTGVQLFDQDGRPLDIDPWMLDSQTVLWRAGTERLRNVFPIPDAGSNRTPRLPQPPLLAVPPVTLPGEVSAPSATVDPSTAEEGSSREAAAADTGPDARDSEKRGSR